jgi:hypothetical protein
VKPLYLFKNKYEILAYSGEILTMRVGDLITETIKSPDEATLRLFGYRELVSGQRPEPRPGYAIEMYYELEGDHIVEKYEFVEIES